MEEEPDIEMVCWHGDSPDEAPLIVGRLRIGGKVVSSPVYAKLPAGTPIEQWFALARPILAEQLKTTK